MRSVFLLALLSTAASTHAARWDSSPRALSALTREVDTQVAAAEVDPRYVSVALDVAHVVGARFWDRGQRASVMGLAEVPRFDFEAPVLRRLAAPLGPAYLRVGGTDADRVVYDFPGAGAQTGAESARPRPDGTFVLTAQQWDRMSDFARALDFHIMFTLNAGRAGRDGRGDWRPDSARPLLAHAARRGDPVGVWELGNEPNVYPLLHGHYLSAGRYARDVARARALIDELTPGARLAGPAVAFWPRIGEGPSFLQFFRRFLHAGGDQVDIATWHYYPTQSFRCPVATNRARAGRVLPPRQLDEVDRWADYVARARGGRGPELWLGETGPAQCGGEPGFSDRFASTFWWLDQLGRTALAGQPVVIRQALVGGDYGLIEERDLRPSPDYWATLLWRRTMGTRVLHTSAGPADGALRLYAHCTPDGPPGAVSALLINLAADRATTVTLPGLSGRADLYSLTADAPESREVRLNGTALRASPDGDLPELLPIRVPAADGDALAAAQVTVPPLSVLFAVFPDAAAQACR